MKRREWFYGIALLLCVGISATANVKADGLAVEEVEAIQEILQALVEENDAIDVQGAVVEDVAANEVQPAQEIAGEEVVAEPEVVQAQQEQPLQDSRDSVKTKKEVVLMKKMLGEFADKLKNDLAVLNEKREEQRKLKEKLEQRRQEQAKAKKQKSGKKPSAQTAKAEGKSKARLTDSEVEAQLATVASQIEALQDARFQDLVRMIYLSSWAHATNEIIEALPNTTENGNVAVGYQALDNVTTGSANIALGYLTGSNIEEGHDNIYLGANVGADLDDESSVVRIGTGNHEVFIPGIAAHVGSGTAVVIDADGELLKLGSSARYKKDIVPLASSKADSMLAKVLKLKPSTYVFRSDSRNCKQIGLIAEEVAEVLPELVVVSKEGVIDSVKYDQLAVVAIKAIQEQQALIEQQKKSIKALEAKISRLS